MKFIEASEVLSSSSRYAPKYNSSGARSRERSEGLFGCTDTTILCGPDTSIENRDEASSPPIDAFEDGRREATGEETPAESLARAENTNIEQLRSAREGREVKAEWSIESSVHLATESTVEVGMTERLTSRVISGLTLLSSASELSSNAGDNVSTSRSAARERSLVSVSEVETADDEEAEDAVDSRWGSFAETSLSDDAEEETTLTAPGDYDDKLPLSPVTPPSPSFAFGISLSKEDDDHNVEKKTTEVVTATSDVVPSSMKVQSEGRSVAPIQDEIPFPTYKQYAEVREYMNQATHQQRASLTMSRGKKGKKPKRSFIRKFFGGKSGRSKSRKV